MSRALTFTLSGLLVNTLAFAIGLAVLAAGHVVVQAVATAVFLLTAILTMRTSAKLGREDEQSTGDFVHNVWFLVLGLANPLPMIFVTIMGA